MKDDNIRRIKYLRQLFRYKKAPLWFYCRLLLTTKVSIIKLKRLKLHKTFSPCDFPIISMCNSQVITTVNSPVISNIL